MTIRIDGVSWQKSKMKHIRGFLSEEGGYIIFTKYKQGHDEHIQGYMTKQEFAQKRLMNKIVGVLMPEKELWRVNKNDITVLSVAEPNETEYGGIQYYSVYATFEVGGVEYMLSHGTNSSEEINQLSKILGK